MPCVAPSTLVIASTTTCLASPRCSFFVCIAPCFLRTAISPQCSLYRISSLYPVDNPQPLLPALRHATPLVDDLQHARASRAPRTTHTIVQQPSRPLTSWFRGPTSPRRQHPRSTASSDAPLPVAKHPRPDRNFPFLSALRPLLARSRHQPTKEPPQPKFRSAWPNRENEQPTPPDRDRCMLLSSRRLCFCGFCQFANLLQVMKFVHPLAAEPGSDCLHLVP